MVIAPFLQTDRVRSEPLAHLTQNSWNVLFHLDTQKVHNYLWFWTQDQADSYDVGSSLSRISSLMQGIRSLSCKGIGLAIADPDISVYTGVSFQ